VRSLRELGRAAVPVQEASRAAYQRERVTRALSRALRRVTLARRPSRRVMAWLSVAAAVFLVGGSAALVAEQLARQREPARAAAEQHSIAAEHVVGVVTVEHAGTSRPAVVGDVFRGGEVVRTGPSSQLSVGIEKGSAALGASGELEFAPPTDKERRVRLGLGKVEFDVPRKLTGGRHLVVETPDVDVLVVGTAFSVGVERTDDTVFTEVSVRRGTVWILEHGKQRAVLHAGDTWRTPRPSAAEPPPSSEPAVARARRSGGDSARASGEGTLAEENRLFQSALSARNSGDPVAAADAFGQLLARYPRSVLAEQALAERFRALERAGRTSGAAATARRYLTAYPNGFARADARRISQGELDDR
jgi:hypothetical protein